MICVYRIFFVLKFTILSKYILYLLFYHILQCYYLGGLEESATKIVTEMSKPLSWGLPVDKVCQKLKKKDVQVCDLRYGKIEYLII